MKQRVFALEPRALALALLAVGVSLPAAAQTGEDYCSKLFVYTVTPFCKLLANGLSQCQPVGVVGPAPACATPGIQPLMQVPLAPPVTQNPSPPFPPPFGFPGYPFPPQTGYAQPSPAPQAAQPFPMAPRSMPVQPAAAPAMAPWPSVQTSATAPFPFPGYTFPPQAGYPQPSMPPQAAQPFPTAPRTMPVQPAVTSAPVGTPSARAAVPLSAPSETVVATPVVGGPSRPATATGSITTPAEAPAMAPVGVTPPETTASLSASPAASATPAAAPTAKPDAPPVAVAALAPPAAAESTQLAAVQPAPAEMPHPAPVQPAAAETTPAMLQSAPAAADIIEAVAHFAFDSAELTAAGRAELDAWLARTPRGTQVVVTGHADRLGPAPYNLKLSQRRAETVRRYLIERGWDARDIQIVAKGEAAPVKRCKGAASPATIACLAPNRRVEIDPE